MTLQGLEKEDLEQFVPSLAFIVCCMMRLLHSCPETFVDDRNVSYLVLFKFRHYIQL